MADEFATPEMSAPAAASENRRRMLLIGGAAVLLLCCCCALALAGWYGGDFVLEYFLSDFSFGP